MVVSIQGVFIGVHPTKCHLEVWNYYAHYVLFNNCLRIAVIRTLHNKTRNRDRLCMGLLISAKNGP